MKHLKGFRATTLTLTSVLVTALFVSQAAMAGEFVKEGARDDYSDHPHFTTSEVKSDLQVEKTNYLIQAEDTEIRTYEDLLPDPES